MAEETEKLNGAVRDRTEGAAPEAPARILLGFHPDGTPSLQLQGVVTPTQLLAAAKWLERLGTLQVDALLLAQLQRQAPRVVVPR